MSSTKESITTLSFFESLRLRLAARFVQRLLTRLPHDPSLLARLGLIELNLGSHESAVQHFEQSLGILPNDPNVRFNLGRGLEHLGKLRDALRCYEQAISIYPDFVDARARRDALAQRMQEDADPPTKKSSNSNKRRPDGAEPSSKNKHKPKKFAGLDEGRVFAQAMALQQEGKYKKAMALYQQILKVQPKHSGSLHMLGLIAIRTNNHRRAVELIGEAIEINPNDADFYSNRGLALQELEQLDAAVASYDRAIAINPSLTETYNNRGNALAAQGKQDEAIASYRHALSLKPDFAEAHNNLGAVFQNQGKLDEAAASFRKASSLNRDYAEAHGNLGFVFQSQGKIDDAIASYRKALSIKPDFAAVHFNLGLLLQSQGKLDEAIASYRKALSFKSHYVESHNNLGIIFRGQGKLDEAIASFRKAIAFNPDSFEAHSNLGYAWQNLGRLADAEASYRRSLKINPNDAIAHSNLLFALNYQSEKTDEEVLAIARGYDAKFGVPARPAWKSHFNDREISRRLKVGYVSPDFRRHAIANFAEPILTNHDRAQVEVYCYAEVRLEDDTTRRFQRMADHWHSTVGMSDDAVAELVHSHQIDILVDLAGHTASNRLLAFARKPAPVQVTYLGYPATTGLTAMDYRITDCHADPEGIAETRYVEQLVRLPDSLWCYRPAPDMPAVTPLPALTRGYVTYGSFNNFSKIDRPTIELWASLLREQSNARLMFLVIPKGEAQRQLVRSFAEHGVDAQRLIVHDKLSAEEYYRCILDVDIALDPVTVNGGTTSCECLWLGVPVISLTGTRFLSRAGLSLLKTIGMADLAADTMQEYLRIAARLAGNLPMLAEIRSGLRAQIAASPLTDETRFTRNLEAAYRRMWSNWCASRDDSEPNHVEA